MTTEKAVQQLTLFYRLNRKSVRYGLFVLTLSCCLSLLLSLDAGLLIVLSFTELGKDTCAGNLTLKTTEGTIQRLAFLQLNFCHSFSLPPVAVRDISLSTNLL